MSNPESATPMVSSPDQTLQGPPEDLFPLILTPFEQMMLDDDRPDYPRIFSVVTEFEGCIDRTAYEASMISVIVRNPLLSATIRKSNSKWHWIGTPFSSNQIQWGTFDEEHPIPPFDLRKSPGFVAVAKTNGTTSILQLTFHHAVCDGQGARRVVLDWITFYGQRMSPIGHSAQVDLLNYERLRQRGIFNSKSSAPKTVESPPESVSLIQQAKIIYEFISRQPSPIRSKGNRRTDKNSESFHTLSHAFDENVVKKFRDLIRGSRITLNDVAIALLMNSIVRWNRICGETGNKRMYRILVPFDLRESEDKYIPAANRMSFVFLTRPADLCLDLPRLLETIRSEMDYIDQHQSKYNLIHALPTLQLIPGLVPFCVRLPMCLSTAVLTNVGNTLRSLKNRFPDDNGRPMIGNLRFIRANGAPPIRSRTHLGIGLAITSGELALQGQFDSRIFSNSDAQEFMTLFIDGWNRWSMSPQGPQTINPTSL